jgi:excisionase family DNA binding protein
MPKQSKGDGGSTYTVRQAWRKLGPENITLQAIYLAVARREIPSIRLGRRVLIPKQAFDEFLLGSKESAA